MLIGQAARLQSSMCQLKKEPLCTRQNLSWLMILGKSHALQINVKFTAVTASNESSVVVAFKTSIINMHLFLNHSHCFSRLNFCCLRFQGSYEGLGFPW